MACLSVRKFCIAVRMINHPQVLALRLVGEAPSLLTPRYVPDCRMYRLRVHSCCENYDREGEKDQWQV